MSQRLLGLSCAVAAVALGLVYLVSAGAPFHYLAIQAAALGIGLALFFLLGRPLAGMGRSGADRLMPVLALALLATALFGREVDGAARWVAFGTIYLQTSLILLPLLILLFARSPSASGAVSMIVAAAALAIQPDRAMAGALCASLLVLLALRRNRPSGLAAAAGMAGFLAAMLQPDALAAVPYVDLILYTAFDVHPAIGAAVIIGAGLLLVPALGSGDRNLRWAFAACWGAILVAAALGHYPTPLVGYGGSAVLGYLLGLTILPMRQSPRIADVRTSAEEAGSGPGELHRAAV